MGAEGGSQRNGRGARPDHRTTVGARPTESHSGERPIRGLRHYFFSATTFSDQWFADHVVAAKLAAGPRYNRERSLETPISQWFSSFGGGPDWQGQLANRLDPCRKATSHVEELVGEKGGDAMRPEWPEAARDKGKQVIGSSRSCIQIAEELAAAPTEDGLSKLQASISRLLDDLDLVEGELAADVDAKHGEGSADSKQFRSYMAEYMKKQRGRESVCYERDYRGSDGRGALFMMREGPSRSACRRRLHTAASGVDQESSS